MTTEPAATDDPDVHPSDDDVQTPGDARPNDAEVREADDVDATGDAESASGDTSRRTAAQTQLRRAGIVLFMLLIFNYLVFPQLATARKAAETLSNVTWWLLIVAFALEMAALASYSGLTMAAFPGDRRNRPIRFFTLLRIQLSVKSVTNLVPGGSATGSALGYRMLINAGVPGADAGFAIATVGIGSAVVLNLVLWVALVVSLPRSGFQPGYTTAAIVGAVAIAFVAAMVVLLVKGHGPLDKIVRAIARKVPRMSPDAASHVLSRIVNNLRDLAARPEVIRRGIAWAVANWLFDAAALWVFLAAFGEQVPVDSLLVAFGIANVLAVVPITPGGLGVVEAVLTSTLVGFGVPSGPAAVGVVTYRLAQFWFPIPLGGMAYLSLKVGPTKVASRRERMRALADEAFDPALQRNLP